MADINKLLSQMLGSGAAGGFAGGLAGGLASNILTSKKGRKLGKKALKMGGIATVGALAYGAFQKYNSGQLSKTPAVEQKVPAPPLPPAPENSPFLPASNDSRAEEQFGLLLVRAMIAAARSDGTLDARESQAIFERIQTLDLSHDEKTILIEEMGREVDMDAILAGANSPEAAAEIYLASLLAINVDTPAEQGYLTMLAARLKLPQELIQELHRQVVGQSEQV